VWDSFLETLKVFHIIGGQKMSCDLNPQHGNVGYYLAEEKKRKNTRSIHYANLTVLLMTDFSLKSVSFFFNSGL
jgi:hypothetical protein